MNRDSVDRVGESFGFNKFINALEEYFKAPIKSCYKVSFDFVLLKTVVLTTLSRLDHSP